MTADDFADLLSKLLGEAEDAGLSSEEMLDVLEVMAEVVRDEDVVPSIRTAKRKGEPQSAPSPAQV